MYLLSKIEYEKLTLNKTTVSNLNNLSMKFVQAGAVNADDPKPVILVPTYCDNCADSRATQCLHSCFYACGTSRLCLTVEEVGDIAEVF